MRWTANLLINTVEGAHKEVENLLQRMRELAVQSANDTNNDQDRSNLQAEMNALITEIDRISSTTTWAGEGLVSTADGKIFSFQVGAATGQKNQIGVTIDVMSSSALGLGAGSKINVDFDSTTGGFGPTGTLTDINPNDASLGALLTPTTAGGTVTLNLGTSNATPHGSFDQTVTGWIPFDPVTPGDTVTLTFGNDGTNDVTFEIDTTDQSSLQTVVDLINGGGGDPALMAGVFAHGVAAQVMNTNGYSQLAVTITGFGSNPIKPATIDDIGIEQTPGSDIIVAVDTTDASTLQNAVDTINDGSGAQGSGAGTAAHGVAASIDTDTGSLKLVAGTGSPINTVAPTDSAAIGIDSANAASVAKATIDANGVISFNNDTATVTLKPAEGNTAAITANITSNDLPASADAINAQTGATGITASVVTGENGADDTLVLTALSDSGGTGSGGGTTSVASGATAITTIATIDLAITTVNAQRSELGAVSNRLNHTANNLTNISANLSAAKGGIEDADFALETTALAKNQILQQASTAMLAQANASKQNVLSLLQG
ncbi:flagellin [bacterium]|nr:flagellin [bacterium]